MTKSYDVLLIVIAFSFTSYNHLYKWKAGYLSMGTVANDHFKYSEMCQKYVQMRIFIADSFGILSSQSVKLFMTVKVERID